MSRRPRGAVSVLAMQLTVMLLAGCSGRGTPDASSAPSPTTLPPTTLPTTATAAPPVVPAGVLAAVPQQARDDVAAGRFQVRVVNGSAERFVVRGVQFVWDGFTTEVVPRDDTVVAGQRVDFAVPLPAATCAGDGGRATMPPVGDAVVLLTLDTGEVREVPVFDTDGVAQQLYLRDCERQLVAAAVHLEWTELATGELGGRPVTTAVLRATRGSATGDVTVLTAAGTIPFNVAPASPAAAGEPLLHLPAGEATAEVAVVFTEARCDAHAVAEAKQPFNFLVQLDLGDGTEHPFVVLPPEGDRPAMLATAAAACDVLGEDGALG